VPKPVVMAVNGIAFTLSIELALAADIVIAAGDVRSGSWRSAAGSCRSAEPPSARPRNSAGATRCDSCSLPRSSAPRGPADRARPGGGPAGAHVTRATELAQLIARQAPLGVQATLASARAGLGHGPDAARQCLASLLPGILRSQDAAEGLRSFLERREARFTSH
jgi:enoyl-CoA hydratase